MSASQHHAGLDLSAVLPLWLCEARNQNISADSVEELVEFAVAHDPDHDAARNKKRLDKIVQVLTVFHADPENRSKHTKDLAAFMQVCSFGPIHASSSTSPVRSP